MPGVEEIRLVVDLDAKEVTDRFDEAAQAQKDIYLASLIEAQKKADENHSKEAKKLQREIDLLQRQAAIEAAEEQVKVAKTYEERLAAEKNLEEAKRKQNQEEQVKKFQKMFDSAIDAMAAKIETSAKSYSDYVDRIQVRLLGTGESFSSIASTMSKAFGASPIFQMKNVMEKTAAAIEKGITFNVEARAAMQVVSEKVAATFEAFDSSLLRIIKIQQADSTQARLGMESMLTEFLNKSYQDTTYLQGLSKTVTSNLLEAESRLSREEATQFEYIVQKYLGSMSSVGVSDNLVQQLSQGLGYLASGNISALSSNSQLEQLLVAASNRGGANYGDMLINGMSADNVSQVMSGIYSLVQEIGSSKNAVAVSQYAQLFGMSMSDIRAVMNLTSQDLKSISSDMVVYSDMTRRVETETSFAKLMSRTGGANLIDNLLENMWYTLGSGMGTNPMAYLAYQVGDLVSGMLEGTTTSIAPWGVGVELDIGRLAKVANVSIAALEGVGNLFGALGSIGGVNLSGFTDAQRAGARTGSANVMSEVGTNESLASYNGDFSDGALANSSKQIANKAAVEQTDTTFDAEKKRTEQMVESTKEIGDNVRFIVELLNEHGIVIRGSTGYTQPVVPSFSNDVADTGNDPGAGSLFSGARLA